MESSQIASNLYLGCINAALDQPFLRRAGVTGIVNATVNGVNGFPESYEYLRVSINDSSSERIGLFFPSVFDFIQRHRTAGHAVLVHCQVGVSRSATLVLAYLMMSEQQTLGEVYRRVQHIRPQIDPNPGFIKELRELERSLFGQVCTDERLTYLDIGSTEISADPIDILLNLLGDMTAGFAADAPETSLEKLKDQLTHVAHGIDNQDILVKIIDQGICKCVEMFGGSNARDKRAREGLKKGLTTLCALKGMEMKEVLDDLRTSVVWEDLCIDVPLANRWLNDLEE